MWDPTEFYDDFEHYFKIMLTCGPKLVYDTADMAKMLTCGTLKNFMTTWNTIFEKMLTCGTLLNFMTTWNNLFLK
jgi:hypothetical protein